MYEKLLLVVVAAILSGFSAWWAGRLGVRRALEQKRAERAFERRLDWYERAIRAISEHAAALHHVVIGAQHGFNEPAMHDLVDQMVAKQPAVTAVIGEALMYATPESAALVAEMSRRSTALLTADQVDPQDRSKGFQFDASRLEEAARLAFGASNMLASEMRSHIGLEPLESKSLSSRAAQP